MRRSINEFSLKINYMHKYFCFKNYTSTLTSRYFGILIVYCKNLAITVIGSTLKEICTFHPSTLHRIIKKYAFYLKL